MKSVFVSANTCTGDFKRLNSELKHDFLVFEVTSDLDLIADVYTPGGYIKVNSDKGNYSQVTPMWNADKRLIAIAMPRDWDLQAAPKILKDILLSSNMDMDFIVTFCQRAGLGYEDTASGEGFKAFNMTVV